MPNWSTMSVALKRVAISVACDADFRGLMNDQSARKKLTVAQALEVDE